MTSVLMLKDAEGWSADTATQSLQFYLSRDHGFSVDVALRPVLRFHEEDTAYDIVFLYCNFNTSPGQIAEYRNKNVHSKLVCGVRGWMGFSRVHRKLAGFDAVNTNNLVLLDRLRNFHNNVHLCHAGVDTQLFKPANGMDFGHAFVVGWVGDEHKHVKNSYVLDMLGFPYVKATKQTGYTIAEMPHFYNGIDVLVNTSYWKGWPTAEGSPLPVLEAAACGKPVIAPESAGAAREFLDAYQVVNGDFLNSGVLQMRNKLSELQKDPVLAARLGSRNRDIAVSEWDWSVKACAFASFLGSVL